ncbi:ArsR family transcriptional regulator [Bremerella cremea]|uniref:Transcriptional regulator n=1 Tax=Blastopirellula marina TaxID=124 RepID=A0A2S8FYX4_9BACT|nr:MULTISPECIES: metalloregulator ArsR/SmtB family transcription factor [Pirellulaceae]PQO37399.1 transcriptional regulator [Blastopirellula marina]RCS49786.1 ArsR family transcriptional regulator [Bremerella cremea]
MSKCTPDDAACDASPVKILPEANAQSLADLAWALAHPARVQILRILIQREACVCGEIVGQLPLAQSTVSQHLKILKKAGLVQGEVDGPKMCYCVNRKALQELKALVAAL